MLVEDPPGSSATGLVPLTSLVLCFLFFCLVCLFFLQVPFLLLDSKSSVACCLIVTFAGILIIRTVACLRHAGSDFCFQYVGPHFCCSVFSLGAIYHAGAVELDQLHLQQFLWSGLMDKGLQVLVN